MNTFEKTLCFFKEQEQISLENSPQKMNNPDESERQKSTGNGSGRPLRKRAAPVACVSRTLFEIPPQSSFFPLQLALTIGHLFLAFLSKFVHGQYIITFFDFYMIKLERTLDFCVPQEMSVGDIAEIHRKTLTTTDRPLTWIFFLPALIVLRFFRFWASVVSIMLGRGEITAKLMRSKIVEFRRYYRSVRHYAVKKFTKDELELKETRCASSFIWRFIYTVDSKIFMRKPPVEVHSNMPRESSPLEQADKSARLRNGGPVKKNSLNEIDDSTDEEVLTTEQMLEQFSKLKESQDPDYEPEEEPSTSSEEISSDAGVDTEEEKTESQKHLNASANTSSNLSGNGSNNGFASDLDLRSDKSKKDSSSALDKIQMQELENQLVQKIMSHFKSNFNYNPPNVAVEDVFYSPIAGSPPDKGYTSDSEYPSKTNDESRRARKLKLSADNQSTEITSTSPKLETQEAPNTQVVEPQQ